MLAEPSLLVTTDPVHANPRVTAPPHEAAPGVLVHSNFVNTYALSTPAGLLLVDPGLAPQSAAVHAAVRAWSAAPLHTVVYTHGHADHAFGLAAFLEAGERGPHGFVITEEQAVRGAREVEEGGGEHDRGIQGSILNVWGTEFTKP